MEGVHYFCYIIVIIKSDYLFIIKIVHEVQI